MKIDFSEPKATKIEYQKRLYLLDFDATVGWYVVMYNSVWDNARRWGAPGQRISGHFKDPRELIRSVTIDGRTIEDIISDLPEEDPARSYPYNYDWFLADIFNRMNFGFFFRGRFYSIRYWSKNHNDPAWIPGWKFSADKGGEVLICSKKFDEFIRQVDLWMVEHTGKMLRDVFDHCYMEHNSGELAIDFADINPDEDGSLLFKKMALQRPNLKQVVLKTESPHRN